MTKRLQKILATISAAVLAANAAFAQEETAPAETAGAEGVLESVESRGLDVSAAALASPENSTLITSDEISQTLANSVPEILTQLTTVRLVGYTGNPNDGQLAMRGFGENSQLRISVIVDGVRYNREDMNAVPWLQIPTANIESIEVLRGANSARYGNNAVAGVVKIKTKDVSDKDTLSISGMYGSYGTYDAQVYGSVARGDYFATVNARRFYTDGYRDFSESHANNYGATVGCFIDENNTFYIRGSYSDTYTEFPAATSYQQMLDNPRYANGKNFTYECSSYTISGTFEHDSARSKGFATFSFDSYERDILYPKSRYPVNDDQLMYAFASEFETEVARDLRLYAGLDWRYTTMALYNDAVKYLGRRIPGVEPPPGLSGKYLHYRALDADVERFDIGIKAGGIYEITEELSSDICARFDAANTAVDYTERKVNMRTKTAYISQQYDRDVWQKGGALTAALNYKIDKNSSAYLKFDQLFRYPSTDEIALYWGYSGADYIMFNPDLSPETGQNIELGYKYEGENLTVNASIYALFMQDEIMCLYTDTAAGTLVNDNAPDTLRLGADLYAKYDVGFGGTYAGASFVDARFTEGKFDGNFIPLVPWFNCFAGVFVRPIDRVVFAAQCNYATNQYSGSDMKNTERKMPEYVTLDLRLNIKCCDYAWLYMAAENVLDEHYALAAFGSYYPAMGRMLKIGLNLKF